MPAKKNNCPCISVTKACHSSLGLFMLTATCTARSKLSHKTDMFIQELSHKTDVNVYSEKLSASSGQNRICALSHKTHTLIQELLHKTDMFIRNCRVKNRFIQELSHKTDMFVPELSHKTDMLIQELSHKTG